MLYFVEYNVSGICFVFRLLILTYVYRIYNVCTVLEQFALNNKCKKYVNFGLKKKGFLSFFSSSRDTLCCFGKLRDFDLECGYSCTRKLLKNCNVSYTVHLVRK